MAAPTARGLSSTTATAVTFLLTRKQCLGTSAGFRLVAPEHRRKMSEKVAALTPEAPKRSTSNSVTTPKESCAGKMALPLLFDDVGRLVEIVSTGRDVTERRVTEETIRRNQNVIDYSRIRPDSLLWEGDPETLLFTYVSESAEGLLGVPTARWYEPGFWPAHIHAEDREEALTSCRLSTGPP